MPTGRLTLGKIVETDVDRKCVYKLYITQV